MSEIRQASQKSTEDKDIEDLQARIQNTSGVPFVETTPEKGIDKDVLSKGNRHLFKFIPFFLRDLHDFVSRGSGMYYVWYFFHTSARIR